MLGYGHPKVRRFMIYFFKRLCFSKCIDGEDSREGFYTHLTEVVVGHS